MNQIVSEKSINELSETEEITQAILLKNGIETEISD